MKKIGFLTCQEVPGYGGLLTKYDTEMVEYIRSKGYECGPVIWDQEKEPEKFDLLFIRTIWDYYKKYDRFYDFLDEIFIKKIPMLNSPMIVSQNMHKFYLRKLIARGVNVIDTSFFIKNTRVDLKDIMKLNGWDKLIFKPAVSAGSYLTTLVNSYSAEHEKQWQYMIRIRDMIVQPFQEEIYQGEISNVFWNNQYKYSLKKTPKNGDFRVQFNFGGEYKIHKPSDVVLEECKKVMRIYGNDAFYVRIDGIETGNEFKIMEVEMIEPDLYLDYFPEAKYDLAEALLSKL
jgi:glutathione synthase/RimK-type ligase-like ATP-grasp enzyme